MLWGEVAKTDFVGSRIAMVLFAAVCSKLWGCWFHFIFVQG